MPIAVRARGHRRSDATNGHRWWTHSIPVGYEQAAPRTARYDWEDGSTRVVVAFDRIADDRSRIAVQHERLPDADAADAMKAWWREQVAALKARLEAES